MRIPDLRLSILTCLISSLASPVFGGRQANKATIPSGDKQVRKAALTLLSPESITICIYMLSLSFLDAHSSSRQPDCNAQRT